MFSELIKGLIALGVPADNRVNLGFFRVLEADRFGLTIGNRGKKFCFLQSPENVVTLGVPADNRVQYACFFLL